WAIPIVHATKRRSGLSDEPLVAQGSLDRVPETWRRSRTGILGPRPDEVARLLEPAALGATVRARLDVSLDRRGSEADAPGALGGLAVDVGRDALGNSLAELDQSRSTPRILAGSFSRGPSPWAIPNVACASKLPNRSHGSRREDSTTPNPRGFVTR